MSNLPAWKNVISGGIPPDGSPLYYYSPAPSFNGGGGGSGSVAYADSAGTALTASYVDIRGNGITVNYFGSHIQLTGSGGATSISASYALSASYSENSDNAISASHADSASTAYIANIALNAISASYSVYADTANFAKTAESSSYSPYASTASYVPLTYGPGILYDPNFPMAFSASVRSVNGIFPTDGNINTTLVGVTTGTSASLALSSSGAVTASITEGEVWVISNDPTSSNNGRSFIYDEDNTTGAGTWYELSPLDLSVTDARYLKLDAANGPMQGNINMGGYNITAGNLVGTSSWSEKALSASYVNVTGSGIVVNYNGSQIQLTGSATVLVQDTLPGIKNQGSLWFNSNDGNTYLQYNSPDGNVWIPAATSVGQAFSASHANTATTASVALSVLNAPPAGAIVSATSPGAKQSGSLWWNSDEGNLYVQVASPFGSSYVSAMSSLPAGPISASYAATSSIADSARMYFIQVTANTTYALPSGYVNDPCRYSVMGTTINVPTSWFNTTTYRFTPLLAGYWDISGEYDIFRGAPNESYLSIVKNTTAEATVGGFGAVQTTVRKILYLNGTTDYVYIGNSGNGTQTRTQSNQCWFQARWIGN